MMKRILFASLWMLALVLPLSAQEADNVIDEVIWVVGDEAILRSDVESQRLYMQSEGIRMDGDPYCIIPEQLAVQKLFLHQAKLDSIEPNETSLVQQVDRWMSMVENQIGSREKMEEYFNQKYSQIRDTRLQTMRDQQIVQQMQQKIVGDVKLTPSDVRRYFNQLPKDSLPNIPLSVEAEIITMEPKIPIEEIDAIKARLREFTAEVDSGKISFAALATLYSDDKESAKRGGELGFMGKADLLPAFANVAFNLTDPKKVSNIVETEYGYHIIQLIEKRGDRINVRHILLRPRVSDKELAAATNRMDSLYDDIMAKKFSFEDAATYVSADKETRNNKGLMVNKDMNSTNYSTPRFEMQELPPEVAKAIDTMKVGSISKPFTMINDKSKEVVAIVKLMARTPAHKANLADDYLMLKNRAEAKQKQEILDKWIADKQKTTYIRIAPGWGQCKFKYPGWIKK